LLNIIVQEFLFEAKSITAFFDSIREVVNLEQEQDVVLVYFLVVPSDKIYNIVLEFG